MSLLRFFGLESLAPSPTDDFWYNAIGAQTTAGVRVDNDSAFAYSVCWAATRLLAGTAGWLPFNLYRRLPSGGAEIDKSHRIHRLIHDQPNDDMGAMMFRARGVNHQVNWGNCFAEIERNGGGIPVALHPIHPRRIPVATNIVRKNGKLVYLVNQDDGSKLEFPSEAIFHVPSIISDDGIIGKGVITNARETIGKALGTQLRGASALKNGGAPPLALKNGKFRNPAEREDFRRQINEVHGGPENAGKWLLLPQESEVQMLGFSLKDSEFIESQQFDIEEISRWYGVPPHLVGHLLRATFNNIEELGISFVKYSLILWLKLWEQEVWRKLLTKQEQQTHYAKFVVDALERGNLANRTEAGVKKFFNGLWTLNDWAEQEDMNPITETTVIDGQTINLGNVHFVQQAMIPLARAAKGQTDKPAERPRPDKPEDDDGGLRAEFQAGLTALRQEIPHGLNGEAEKLRTQLAATRASQRQLAAAVLRDVMSRMVSLEVNAVKRVAEKPEKFTTRLQEFYDKHKDTMIRALAEPYAALLSAKSADNGDDFSEPGYLAKVVNRHIAESLKQLDALLDCTADQFGDKVDKCVSKWHEERVML